MSLLNRPIKLFALLTVGLPVYGAGEHGHEGEALSSDTGAEHAVGFVVVAGAHAALGGYEGPDCESHACGLLARGSGEVYKVR